MKNQIKELRVKIDGLAQLTKAIVGVKTKNPHYQGWGPEQGDPMYFTEDSKQVQEAYDSLIFAKAWLGKLLGDLGVESPYPKDGTRKTAEDIEPTADVAKTEINTPDGKRWLYYSDLVLQDWIEQDKSHIEKVDWLRQQIEKVVNEIKHLDGGMTNHAHQRPSREFAIARTNAYTYACEARMWLGFELARIKEESKK